MEGGRGEKRRGKTIYPIISLPGRRSGRRGGGRNFPHLETEKKEKGSRTGRGTLLLRYRVALKKKEHALRLSE